MYINISFVSPPPPPPPAIVSPYRPPISQPTQHQHRLCFLLLSVTADTSPTLMLLHSFLHATGCCFFFFLVSPYLNNGSPYHHHHHQYLPTPPADPSSTHYFVSTLFLPPIFAHQRCFNTTRCISPTHIMPIIVWAHYYHQIDVILLNKTKKNPHKMLKNNKKKILQQPRRKSL